MAWSHKMSGSQKERRFLSVCLACHQNCVNMANNRSSADKDAEDQLTVMNMIIESQIAQNANYLLFASMVRRDQDAESAEDQHGVSMIS